ncbi:MAG TPA: long-chain fatty acid--CoA ligase [Ktedonobacterales bacterium]|nr:long-chain fatty acid--CoA ligase [Ktedonobacterales bacterium]
MNGLMMDYPLTLQHIFNRARSYFSEREIVTLTEEGTHRYTYGDFARRTTRLAAALHKAGFKQGERIATFAWNTYRHLELYFAVPCMGAVLHTLNIRLFADQIVFIANDAEDSVIFVDGDLIPLLEPLADKLPSVRLYVIMGEPSPKATGKLSPSIDYEAFLNSGSEDFAWPTLDENMACAMCYTSGTTGNPKGVVYSHRSTYLHSMATTQADSLALSERDTLLPVVPMFHANAWGLAHASPMVGAKQVFPGRFMDPAKIAGMIAEERVTVAAGVPTIWIGLLQVLAKQQYDLSSLDRILCGGSAVPVSLIDGLQKQGLRIIQAWGMTETSPLATIGNVRPKFDHLSTEEQYPIRAKQGYPVPGVDLRVVDIATGQEVPRDGKTFGEIQVRGPWVAGAYYHDDNPAAKFVDGWFRTGDVANVDEDGYIQIVDRTKDLVKSGGEWISSIELEGLIMGHPKVLEAAVIAVPHPVWQERPVACVVPKPEFKDQITKEEIREYLSSRVAKWWLPDEVLFIDAVPKTSVGKFDKKVLRSQFAGVTLTA